MLQPVQAEVSPAPLEDSLMKHVLFEKILFSICKLIKKFIFVFILLTKLN